MSRNILLGVTGGIAAYKACELTRRLAERGHAVQVVMTDGAQAFVSPLTFQALSGREVRTTLFDTGAEAAMGHIELARWADQLIIAPASADFLARAAQGMADDLLSTLLLASAAPVVMAPAMNQQMWAHPAVQANVQTLVARGVTLLGPGVGDQACGDVGPGRMLEPLEILHAVLGVEGDEQAAAAGLQATQAEFSGLHSGRPLAGRKVLLTAGPTREAIDPVRFLSNRSSGRMGFALAAACAAAGAQVVLVHGPVALPVPAGVDAVPVVSAADMHEAVMSRLDDAEVFIACAAVADYSPVAVADEKIKKTESALTIVCQKNPDILSAVSGARPDIFTVGFAAETSEVERYARQKLQQKRLNMICANEVGATKGFDVEDNTLEVIWSGGQQRLGPGPKTALAAELVALIATLSKQKSV